MTIRAAVYMGAIATAAVLIAQVPRFVPESSPVERGTAAASSHGCIECHGNPDPQFPDDANLSCNRVTVSPAHPPYEGRCSDLLAYFEVVRLKRSFRLRASVSNQNRMLLGERYARQFSCFQCHGELGQGGFRNPGALKGYIPGYFGKDFALLTQDGSTESVRTWISQGIDSALFSTPIEGTIARFFIERQEVSMPVFSSLPDSTIRILADYVMTLNSLGPMDAKAIRAYGLATQKISPIGPGELLSSGIQISNENSNP